jgi:hypothetical protein
MLSGARVRVEARGSKSTSSPTELFIEKHLALALCLLSCQCQLKTAAMHISSLLVAVGLCGVLAAPVDQQPQIFRNKDNIQLPQAANPYTPEYRDPFDRKIDAEGKKLQPLPWVRRHRLQG